MLELCYFLNSAKVAILTENVYGVIQSKKVDVSNYEGHGLSSLQVLLIRVDFGGLTMTDKNVTEVIL